MKDYIKNHYKTAVLIIIGIIILVGVGIALYKPAITAMSRHASPYTITFNTNGGNELENYQSETPVEVRFLAIPQKSGYQFAGWYYDESLTEICSSSDILSTDMTLYAQWGGNITEDYTTSFIDQCNPDFSFLVYCQDNLSSENLKEYLNFENTSFCEILFQVDCVSDHTYRISAADGYPEGFIYKMTSLSGDKLRFLEVGNQDVSTEETASYSFYVAKDNTYKIQFCDGIIMIPSYALVNDQIEQLEGTSDNNGNCLVTFSVPKDNLLLHKGDIIAIGNGSELTPQDLFYRISDISEKKMKGVPVYHITGSTPEYQDIYKEYEIYFNQPVSMEDLDTDIEAMQDNIIRQLQESSMTEQVLYSTACAFKENEQVLSAVETLTTEDQYRFYNMSITDIVDSIKSQSPLIEYKKEEYKDSRGNTFPKTTLSVNITTSKLTFNLGTTSSDGKQVQIQFSATLKFSEEVKVVGYQVIKGNNSYDYTGSYAKTSVAIALEATIMMGEDNPLDITDSIESCLSDVSSMQSAYIEDLQDGNLFQNELQYVTLAEQELGAINFCIYGFSFEIPISVKIEMGIQAGIYTSFSYTETEFVYISTGYMENGEIHNYDEPQQGRITQSSKIHYNFTIKGKMGIRAGVTIGVNVSVCHLNSVFNAGIAFTVGCYSEWTGYASIDKDYERSSYGIGNDISTNSTNVTGAIYWEIGIYGELDFTWKLGLHEGSFSIAEFQIPLLRMGTWNYALGFDEIEKDITTSLPELFLSDPEYVQITTVNLKNGDDAVCSLNAYAADITDPQNICFAYHPNEKTRGAENPVIIDTATGKLTIRNPEERADFDIMVFYLGSKGINSPSGIYTTLHITYLPEGTDDKEVTATFYGKGDDIIAQETLYAGYKPTELYAWDYLSNKYKYGYTLDKEHMWDKEIGVINEDTDYHLNIVPMDCEVFISYKYYNYNTCKSFREKVDQFTVPFDTVLNLDDYIPSDTEYSKFQFWMKSDGTENEYTVDSTTCNFIGVIADEQHFCKVIYMNMYNITGQTEEVMYYHVGDIPKGPILPESRGGRFYDGYLRFISTNTHQYVKDTTPIGENEAIRYYIPSWHTEYPAVFIDQLGNDIKKITVKSNEEIPYPVLSDDQLTKKLNEYEIGHFSGWSSTYSQSREMTIFSPLYEDIEGKEISLSFELKNSECLPYTTDKYQYTAKYNSGDLVKAPNLYIPTDTYKYNYEYMWVGTGLDGKEIRLKPGENLELTENVASIVFKPQVTKTLITYTIHVKDHVYDSEYKTLKLNYGEKITADMISAPTLSPSTQYSYSFSNFNIPLPYVIDTESYNFQYLGINREMTIYADYTSSPRNYTITFDAGLGNFSDGTKTRTVVAPYGSTVTMSEIPTATINGNLSPFASWTPSDNFVVSGDKTYTAIYGETVELVIDNFYVEVYRDNTYIESSQYSYTSAQKGFFDGAFKTESTYTFRGRPGETVSFTNNGIPVTCYYDMIREDLVTGEILTCTKCTADYCAIFYGEDVKNQFETQAAAMGFTVTTERCTSIAPGSGLNGEWTCPDFYKVHLSGLDYSCINLLNNLDSMEYYVCITLTSEDNTWGK